MAHEPLVEAHPVAVDRSFDVGTPRPGVRRVPAEVPIAIECNGIGYAVMMASPAALEDFATGFMLTEGLAAPGEIVDIDVHALQGGMIVRVTLPQDRLEPVLARARRRVSESSCGLCGIESIEQVLRPLPPVTTRIATSRAAIHTALAALDAHQPLAAATGAVHAAAFCTPDGAIVCVREDVGRHNALDKLIGALARQGLSAGDGFFLLTSRCSYELVEKTVRADCPLLVTISAPTSLAVDRARDAGLALVALARRDSMLVLNDPHAGIA
ncbi:formate dehydrogenase accessory sulfurtransferase FdhD [Sphingomonas sp. CJ20]